MLQRGDLVPHFDVTDVHGKAVAYSRLWQRQNLVLVLLPASDPDQKFSHYARQITGPVPGGK